MDDRSVIACKRWLASPEGILPLLAFDIFCLFFDR
jgi:hypothetical protein